MFRLAYRNFGDHESLVANHSVNAGTRTGVRWYEVRSPGSSPVVYQQGTYAPDANHRWMASVAMDSAGDMYVVYNISSTTQNIGVRITGQVAGAPVQTVAAGQTIRASCGGPRAPPAGPASPPTACV